MGAEDGTDLRHEQRVGGVDLPPAFDQAHGLLGRAGVLHGPAVASVASHLTHVLHHALECTTCGANPLDGRDLALEGEDRLDLEGAPQERLGPADATTTLEILEGVEAEPDVESTTSLVHALGHLPQVASRAGARRCREHHAAESAGAGFGVYHLNAVRQPSRAQRAARLASDVPGAGKPAAEVYRDDVLARRQQGLPYREKIPDRGLGRAG